VHLAIHKRLSTKDWNVCTVGRSGLPTPSFGTHLVFLSPPIGTLVADGDDNPNLSNNSWIADRCSSSHPFSASYSKPIPKNLETTPKSFVSNTAIPAKNASTSAGNQQIVYADGHKRLISLISFVVQTTISAALTVSQLHDFTLQVQILQTTCLLQAVQILH
jgi:hypothetical protein